jgi:hypothetical protein
VISATTGYLLVVIVLATIVRSTLGFGEALVAVPLLALRIDTHRAIRFPGRELARERLHRRRRAWSCL